ncbi:unnamed protein product, partial [Rotaria sp. Silwood1]
MENIEPYKEDNTLTVVHLQELTEVEQELTKLTEVNSQCYLEQIST